MNLKAVHIDIEAEVKKNYYQRNYGPSDTYMKSRIKMGPLLTAIIRIQNSLTQALFAMIDPPRKKKDKKLDTKCLIFLCCLCKFLFCCLVYSTHPVTLDSFSIFITYLHTFMKLWIGMFLLHRKSIRKKKVSSNQLEEKVCSANIPQHPCSTPLSGSLNPTVWPIDHDPLWGTAANWGEWLDPTTHLCGHKQLEWGPNPSCLSICNSWLSQPAAVNHDPPQWHVQGLLKLHFLCIKYI